MHGKAVKIRHCPATVSGMRSGRSGHCASGKVASRKASRKSGDRFLAPERITFSREKRPMRTIILLSLSLAALAGETVNIHGAILDPSGRAVQGARVQCGDRSVYTNFEGRFTFANLDRCEARIEKPGFRPQTVQLSAVSDTRDHADDRRPSRVRRGLRDARSNDSRAGRRRRNRDHRRAPGRAQLPDAVRRLPRRPRPADLRSTAAPARSPKSTLAAPSAPARWSCSMECRSTIRAASCILKASRATPSSASK